MKIPIVILLSILTCPAIHVLAQPVSDFIVIDEIADDYAQLKNEFGDQINVYFTSGSTQCALEQILNTLSGQDIENLHLYVPAKPGAIVFSSIAITSDDISGIAEELKALSNFVSNSVVIHNEVVFTQDEGQLLKQKLEEITGLVFTSQK